jgi:hypothetical protein
MFRVDLQKRTRSPDFIGAWQINQRPLCEELISYFEAHQNKHKVGVTSAGKNLAAKDRVDINVTPSDITKAHNTSLKNYIDALHQCYRDYLLQWPFLATMSKELQIGEFNLGRYGVGQHFQKLHTERSSLNTLHRVLAWMTYLNDVEDGGETYFEHYDITIKPSQGLTLIWPAEWTHAHRGNILLDGNKYMVTGWMNFQK